MVRVRCIPDYTIGIREYEPRAGLVAPLRDRLGGIPIPSGCGNSYIASGGYRGRSLPRVWRIADMAGGDAPANVQATGTADTDSRRASTPLLAGVANSALGTQYDRPATSGSWHRAARQWPASTPRDTPVSRNSARQYGSVVGRCALRIGRTPPQLGCTGGAPVRVVGRPASHLGSVGCRTPYRIESADPIGIGARSRIGYRAPRSFGSYPIIAHREGRMPNG